MTTINHKNNEVQGFLLIFPHTMTHSSLHTSMKDMDIEYGYNLEYNLVTLQNNFRLLYSSNVIKEHNHHHCPVIKT